MRIGTHNLRNGSRARSRSEGMVVLVVLVVVAFLLVLVSANTRVLHQMKGRLLLMEEKQKQHWESAGAAGESRTLNVER